MAPVFNLEEMLKAEAEKLRMKVEEASLMAAKAAEEAEEKVKMIAKEAMKQSGASSMAEEEIEDIVSTFFSADSFSSSLLVSLFIIRGIGWRMILFQKFERKAKN